ncbi:hypothetical protein XA68_15660 [Ophiocordyceps unilateralis]|uniref:Uncharacterized protein n=1 Tax=Ophiocordyceps unilateralis TaxID=268505 RepID=A0A2A9P712_OPHUN|nr:hypothetical protein XA68_15660 [Ophiocordyceps unilateralis]
MVHLHTSRRYSYYYQTSRLSKQTIDCTQPLFFDPTVDEKQPSVKMPILGATRKLDRGEKLDRVRRDRDKSNRRQAHAAAKKGIRDFYTL